MTQYKRIAVDTSKSVFTIHCIDAQDQAVLRTNLRRGQMNSFFKKTSSRRDRSGSLWRFPPLGS